MSADAAIVFFPRFSTLVGLGSFSTAPIDVSTFAGVQFQVWRANVPTGYDATFEVYLEESLDAQQWVLGTASPTPVTMLEGETKFFSYSFRLRWFRLRIKLSAPAGKAVIGCWAEGLLRGGGSGVWGEPPPAAQGGVMAGTMAPGAGPAASRRKVAMGLQFDALRPVGGFGDAGYKGHTHIPIPGVAEAESLDLGGVPPDSTPPAGAAVAPATKPAIVGATPKIFVRPGGP